MYSEEKFYRLNKKEKIVMNCKFHVDTKVYRLEPYENYVRITGWCFDIENRNIEFFIKMNGEVVESEVKRNKRSDVEKKYQKKYKHLR